MPFSYLRSDPGVRERIVARIAGGEFLKRICREDGMPCHESVTGWMRRDPAFAAEVRRARAIAEGMRLRAFDEAKGRAILNGLGAGRTIYEIVREPGMPSYRTYMHWRRTQMWFAEEVGRVIAARMQARAHKAAGRYRHYDAAVGERLYVRLWKGERLRGVLRSDKAFPSLAVLARWREEQPQFDDMLKMVFRGWKRKRPAGDRLYRPALAHRVLELVREGHSFRSLSRRRGMPSAGTLTNWMKRHPEFAARVKAACQEREHRLVMRMGEVAKAMPEAGEAERAAAWAPIEQRRRDLNRRRPGVT